MSCGFCAQPGLDAGESEPSRTCRASWSLFMISLPRSRSYTFGTLCLVSASCWHLSNLGQETLEGDNAYEAEGHGKQRAKRLGCDAKFFLWCAKEGHPISEAPRKKDFFLSNSIKLSNLSNLLVWLLDSSGSRLSWTCSSSASTST